MGPKLGLIIVILPDVCTKQPLFFWLSLGQFGRYCHLIKVRPPRHRVLVNNDVAFGAQPPKKFQKRMIRANVKLRPFANFGKSMRIICKWGGIKIRSGSQCRGHIYRLNLDALGGLKARWNRACPIVFFCLLSSAGKQPPADGVTGPQCAALKFQTTLCGPVEDVIAGVWAKNCDLSCGFHQLTQFCNFCCPLPDTIIGWLWTERKMEKCCMPASSQLYFTLVW